MARLDARIAVSATAEQCAEHYFGGTYRVIPNGVDVDRFHPGQRSVRAVAVARQGQIVFVGRLDRAKA